MNDFNDKFEKTTREFPYIHFLSAKIDADKNRVTVTAVYKKEYEDKYGAEKEKILAQIRKLLPPAARVDMTATPVLFSSGEVMRCTLEFLNKESIFVFSSVSKENTVVSTGDKPSVSIGLPSAVAEYAESAKLDVKLKEYLDLRLFSDFTVRFVKRRENFDEIKSVLNATVHKPKFSYERPEEGRRISPAGRTPCYGDLIEGDAQYICDCLEPDFVVLYGTMTDVRVREYTPKKGAEGEVRKFVTFFLDDTTGKIRCVFFPGPKTQGAVKYFEDGANIIADGRLDYDARLGDGSLQFRVRHFSLCERTEFEVNKVVRLVDNDYRYVYPKKYTSLSQSSLYGGKRLPRTDEPLVVFFILTSSQNRYAPGEMIEIAGVKLENGKITETFDSLIRPHVEMTEEARLAVGLLASDLAGKPTFEQVIPDFYKFFDGFILTAWPLDWHFNVLKPYLEKLHIPVPSVTDITRFADNAEFRAVRPKNTRRAMPAAEAYAKILANI